jgi:hypothetical protein
VKEEDQRRGSWGSGGGGGEVEGEGGGEGKGKGKGKGGVGGWRSREQGIGGLSKIDRERG